MKILKKYKIKKWLHLTVFLLIGISAYAQQDTIYTVTASQMRTTAKIFLEHEYLQKENSYLNGNITYYSRIVMQQDESMGMLKRQIIDLNDIMDKRESQIESYKTINNDLQKQLKQKRITTIKYTTIGVVGGVLVGILIKSI